MNKRVIFGAVVIIAVLSVVSLLLVRGDDGYTLEIDIVKDNNIETIKVSTSYPNINYDDISEVLASTETIYDYGKATIKDKNGVITDEGYFAYSPSGDGYEPQATIPQIVSIDDESNGTTILNTNPTFIWTICEDASFYRLIISKSSSFTPEYVNLSDINDYNYPSEYSANATHVTFELPTGNALDTFHTYYVKVQAYNKDS